MMNGPGRRLYLFFLINYFMQGAIGVVYEPLDYLLKDQLGLTSGQAANFIAWMTFPLLLKPLFGLVTDFVPLWGYRRIPHLAAASLTAALAFFHLAAQGSYRYSVLLAFMVLTCLGMAFADVVCGGLLVEGGKKPDRGGPYQALQIGALYLSTVLSGLGGGWMAGHLSYQKIFAAAGCMPLVIAASAFMIRENASRGASAKDRLRIWGFVRTRRFWALSLTILLWNFYPFLGTAQFYYQSNVLKLSPMTIGWMIGIGSVAGLLGSAFFWRFCRDRDIYPLASRAPAVMALVSLGFLFYFGPVSVGIVHVIYGFSSVFFRLALFDLIMRACPTNAEGTFFALFLTLFDIAMYGSNAVGGNLYDFLQGRLAAHGHNHQLAAACLILIGALCTLACRWTLPVYKEEEEPVLAAAAEAA